MNLNFIIEFIVKIIALNPKVYISDKMNLMDSIIIIFIVFDYGKYL